MNTTTPPKPETIININGVRRLSSEYKQYIKQLKEGIVKNYRLAINPDNVFDIYFIIHNLDKPYKRGEYMGLIAFKQNDYPYKAPTISFYTPSGRFAPNTTICTTFTHYHGETWSPAWTLDSLMIGLISFMYDENDGGVGSIKSTPDQKKILAKASKDFNNNHKIYKQYFMPEEENESGTDGKESAKK